MTGIQFKERALNQLMWFYVGLLVLLTVAVSS